MHIGWCIAQYSTPFIHTLAIIYWWFTSNLADKILKVPPKASYFSVLFIFVIVKVNYFADKKHVASTTCYNARNHKREIRGGNWIQGQGSMIPGAQKENRTEETWLELTHILTTGLLFK